MKARLFDSSIVSTAQEALDFIGNILESSTEYSVIGKDPRGKAIGFLLISKDISHELRFAEEIRKTTLFDNAIVGNAQEAVDFIANILESSTEYSIIGKDLDGKILLWNEGARRLYGYEPEEVVGKANSSILHALEDVATGKSRELLDAVLPDGKWEGTIQRRRKNGEQFTARVVITPQTR